MCILMHGILHSKLKILNIEYKFALTWLISAGLMTFCTLVYMYVDCARVTLLYRDLRAPQDQLVLLDLQEIR